MVLEERRRNGDRREVRRAKCEMKGLRSTGNAEAQRQKIRKATKRDFLPRRARMDADFEGQNVSLMLRQCGPRIRMTNDQAPMTKE
jgi:hypothetical protein